MKIEKNKILAPLTTFSIGGKADYFITAKTKTAIIEAIKWAEKRQLNWFILGNASNILIADKGVRGLVIKIKNEKLKINKNKITAEAGVSLPKLLLLAKKNNLSGLEFLVGIPGTVGGAIVANAGSKHSSIAKRVDEVLVLGRGNKVYKLSRKDCNFRNRESRFQKTKEVILAATLSLKKSTLAAIEVKIKNTWKLRKNQPKGKSIGSVFKNPSLAPAGYLIENAGLKGKIIGGAKISDKHANWIINFNNAKATDVLKLIKLAKKRVKKDFKVDLKEEISFMGEF